MARILFPLLLALLLLLDISGDALAHPQQAQTHVHAQPGAVRLPRGLLDGLVDAVLKPVIGGASADCSRAHSDSVNIGATLPLGIAAGVSGSSADARSRPGCSAAAGSSSRGGNGSSGAAASADSNGHGASRSGAPTQPAHTSHGSGAHQPGFSSGEGFIPSGSVGTRTSWGSQSGSQSGSGSYSNWEDSRGNGFSSNEGYLGGGGAVQVEAASGSQSSSQSASGSSGNGASIEAYGQGNLGGGSIDMMVNMCTETMGMSQVAPSMRTADKKFMQAI